MSRFNAQLPARLLQSQNPKKCKDSDKEIMKAVRSEAGFTPKSCWIAHVLSDYGLTKRQAHNRLDPSKRMNPCPDHKRTSIEKALRLLKMI